MRSHFDFADVASDFDAHIAAHLPGYNDVQHLVSIVADHVVPKTGGLIVDVGCSTGASLTRIASRLGPAVQYVGYDVERSMLTQASERMPSALWVNSDVTKPDSLVHDAASLSLLLWTLQFLAPTARDPLLYRLRERSLDSGCVIIAAKCRLTDPRWEDIASQALDEYKESRLLNAQQRVDKTRSLRGVLMAETAEETAHRLIRSGWHSPTILFRWHVWSVIAAFASANMSAEEVLQ